MSMRQPPRACTQITASSRDSEGWPKPSLRAWRSQDTHWQWPLVAASLADIIDGCTPRRQVLLLSAMHGFTAGHRRACVECLRA